MASTTGRYNAWFYDPRYSKRYDMSVTLIFHNNEFCGMGKDEIGLFVVKDGVMNPQNKKISFLKRYHSHCVTYAGDLKSWKTPLEVKGQWHLSDHPCVAGTWGMVLQGSPCHGSLPRPEHPTRSKWEEWGHNILQWVPIPFVATSWDGGAALFYALTGNAKKAKERLYDAGIDAGFDALFLATGGGSALARGAEHEALRGGEIIAREAEETLSRSSSTATIDFNPIADTEADVAEVTRRFESVGVHGAGPPNRGIIGRADSYGSLLENSVRHSVEANHIPPSSATRGTIYEIGERSLPALSTDYELHQGLNRTFGTSGGSNEAREIRNGIKRFLQNRDMQSALKIQILTDYAFWHGIERYENGLRDLLQLHTRTLRSDGRPFLSSAEYNRMSQWLTNEVRRYRQLRAEGRLTQYEVELFNEIVDLLYS